MTCSTMKRFTACSKILLYTYIMVYKNEVITEKIAKFVAFLRLILNSK
jgi:hypothetical protein